MFSKTKFQKDRTEKNSFGRLLKRIISAQFPKNYANM